MIDLSLDNPQLLQYSIEIAREAGALITRIAKRGYTQRSKDDQSPVTEADEEANTFITERLEKLTPNIPIIAEESKLPIIHDPLSNDWFWLVDPLDGTREFIAGRDEYTVNLALVYQSFPAFGLICVPALNTVYWGIKERGSYRQIGTEAPTRIHTRIAPKEGLTVVSSRSHSNKATEKWLQEMKVASSEVAGSSLKFCCLAEGRADVYPRMGRTMEWDTGAGHAILSAAGGRVETTAGNPLSYGKQGFENPNFIAWAK